LPEGKPPYPALVFLHGAGPVTRDSDLEAAFHFRSRGFAVFVFDKRGNGKSQGNWQTASMDELAGDGLAAVRILRRRSDIASGRVGVHGTSQGGWVAAHAASLSSDVGFFITISGPGVPADSQELFRRALNLHGNGYIPGPVFSAADSALADSLMRRTFSFIRFGTDAKAIDAALRMYQSRPWFPVTELPESLFTVGEHEFMSGFRSQMQFSPTAAWSRIKVPALVMFGLQDPFVPARLSADRIRDAVARSGNRSVRIVVLPDADHWMYARRPAKARAPTPGYDPRYLDALRSFLSPLQR
jgi:pimeloyl-ACP methyl ester carboxylesterase